jgi:hypothetical protein
LKVPVTRPLPDGAPGAALVPDAVDFSRDTFAGIGIVCTFVLALIADKFGEGE